MAGPTSTPSKPYSAREKACDCLIGIVFMTVLGIVICATPAAIKLLILVQPIVPDFSVPYSSLAIRNSNNNNISFCSNNYCTIRADWNVTLSINNLDSKGFSYHQIQASSLRDAEFPVSNVTIKPFEQRGKLQQNIQALFPDMAMQSINGPFNLRMEVQVMAKYRGWTWPVHTDSIKVVCKDVKVEFPTPLMSTTLALELGSSSCDVSGRWQELVTKWTTLFWNYLYVIVIFLGILVVSF